MEIVQASAQVDQAVGEAMSSRIEIAASVQCSGVHYGVSTRILRFELHPAFIDVSLLGNMAVSDALVLHDDGSCQQLAGSNRKALATQRCDHVSVVLLQAKDIDIKDIRPQEGNG